MTTFINIRELQRNITALLIDFPTTDKLIITRSRLPIARLELLSPQEIQKFQKECIDNFRKRKNNR